MDKKLNISSCSFKDLYTIEPNSFSDERGSFSRLFCQEELSDSFNFSIKQINHSISRNKGTTRGLHFQYEPNNEAKIITCIKGSIYDVVIDLRKNSPTFLKHYSIILSDINKKMIHIPKGFAHGFQTLEDNTELIYLHDSFYTPSNEGALNVNDPILNIKWPLDINIISQKDKNHLFIDKNFEGICPYEM